MVTPWSHLTDSICALSSIGHPITLWRYIYCQYNESVYRTEQLATIINRIKYKMLTLFTFTFPKRRIRHRTRRRKFRTQTTSATFLTVADWRSRVGLYCKHGYLLRINVKLIIPQIQCQSHFNANAKIVRRINLCRFMTRWSAWEEH